MPIVPDPAAATGLPSDDHVLPIMRGGAATALPDRKPPRRAAPNLAGAIDGVSDCKAMVGLALLAAESLPAGHSVEFMAVLEVVHNRLGAALHTLGAPAGGQRR